MSDAIRGYRRRANPLTYYYTKPLTIIREIVYSKGLILVYNRNVGLAAQNSAWYEDEVSNISKLLKSSIISGIYSIFSKSTGKRYIGSSINIKRRWTHHVYFMKRNKHANKYLNNHLNKYGFDDLVFEILEQTTNLEIQEQYWADFYNAWDRSKGFNISKDVNRPGIALKGRERTKTDRETISRARGMEDFKCLNNGMRFSTIREAGRILNKSSSSISKVLRGIESNVKGLKFAWCNIKRDSLRRKTLINRYCNYKNEKFIKNRASLGGKANLGKKCKPRNTETLIGIARNRTNYIIYCPQLDVEWQSLKECATFFKKSNKTIFASIKRNSKYLGMYNLIKKEKNNES